MVDHFLPIGIGCDSNTLEFDHLLLPHQSDQTALDRRCYSASLTPLKPLLRYSLYSPPTAAAAAVVAA